MKMNRAKRGCIIIIVMIVVLCFLSISNVTAQGSGGPKVIAGQVYNSEGKTPRGDIDRLTGTDASVIVLHDGVKTEYKDPDGLEYDSENGTYWYVVTIPEGAWEEGDTYWIWVEGSKWGDMDFTCTAHKDKSVNSWEMDASGAEWRNVDTADYNFKPVIAWIFALILGVVGIVIGIFRPLKLPASGWPRQSADLTDEILILGTAVIPEAAPEEPVQPSAQPQEPTCPTCNGPLEYMSQYDRWYCRACKKYAPKDIAPQTPQPQEPTCPTCNGPLEYMSQYDRWYCRACKKYAPKDVAPQAPGPQEPQEPQEPQPPEGAPPEIETPPTGGA